MKWHREIEVGGHKRLFVCIEVDSGEEGKARLQKLAADIRSGKRSGAYGQKGPHYCRVESMEWYYPSEDDAYRKYVARWGLFCFPKDD